MKVTYICHSGFAIELEKHVLIFDYYTGEMPVFQPDKQLIVFASHFHPDHYNKRILDLKQQYPGVQYVFSKDIPIRKEERDASMHFMKKRDVADVAGCHIRTLRSNDEGVAYLVQVPDGENESRTIYHAGDLNWWYWEGEPEEENRKLTQEFKTELKALEGTEIDLAFLPLDPRQEAQYFWGFDWFMRHVGAKCAVPMHMWGQYEICETLLHQEESASYRECIQVIHGKGDCFYFDGSASESQTQK
ncbi:MBL fold metallo-hydrolase [Roseburia hominis]